MLPNSTCASQDVFISYASRDQERVLRIADALAGAGVSVWVDRDQIRQSYGPEIVRGIKQCRALMVMCSDASMRSRNVKAEIQLAWKYEKPYLPLLLEQVSFPEQLEYWLEGWQWVEVFDFEPEQWLPRVLRALAHCGVAHDQMAAEWETEGPEVRPGRTGATLEGLRAVGKLTDQIWPLPPERVLREGAGSGVRGLGAPQHGVQHSHRLGSRVCLAVESDRAGHLLLLDEGPERIIYCLCPSWFAPETGLEPGRTYLPQAGSRYDSFVVSGRPGREHLLAVLTDEPLGLDWLSDDPETPARVLDGEDVETVLRRLRALEGDSWTVLSTYFDVVA